MLTLQNLCKSYSGKPAVDGLNLQLKKGEIFGLLGPNGAGKTTTVNLVAGLLTPDQGSVALDGVGRPDDPEVRRSIGVAPQALAIYDRLSALENLRFFGRLQGLSGRLLRERVSWALEFTGLTDRRRDQARNYSGGMKRRLNLAAAVIHHPRLLLLDEPTAGVDPQSRNAIFEQVQELTRQGTTIVYTTHYMEEAERLCDRVGIIDMGQLLAMDSVEALTQIHGGKSVVIAQRSEGDVRIETDDPMTELGRLLNNGSRLRGFKLEQPNLESVFLNLTGRSLRD